MLVGYNKDFLITVFNIEPIHGKKKERKREKKKKRIYLCGNSK